MTNFVNRMNEIEAVPLINDSFDGNEKLDLLQRPLRKTNTNKLTQIALRNHRESTSC